jgi:hypothetical protein
MEKAGGGRGMMGQGNKTKRKGHGKNMEAKISKPEIFLPPFFCLLSCGFFAVLSKN